jgi:hypothetical protein
MVVGRTMSRVTVSTVTSEGCGRTISKTPRPSRISARVYLFSCACGSGFGLKGVISSSSRHTRDDHLGVEATGSRP